MLQEEEGGGERRSLRLLLFLPPAPSSLSSPLTFLVSSSNILKLSLLNFSLARPLLFHEAATLVDEPATIFTRHLPSLTSPQPPSVTFAVNQAICSNKQESRAICSNLVGERGAGAGWRLREDPRGGGTERALRI